MATARTIRVPGAQHDPSPAETPAADPIQQPADGLPNAIDIDARTIRGPVLTRQGWVVPDEAYQRAQAGIRQAL